MKCKTPIWLAFFLSILSAGCSDKEGENNHVLDGSTTQSSINRTDQPIATQSIIDLNKLPRRADLEKRALSNQELPYSIDGDIRLIGEPPKSNATHFLVSISSAQFLGEIYGVINKDEYLLHHSENDGYIWDLRISIDGRSISEVNGDEVNLFNISKIEKVAVASQHEAFIKPLDYSTDSANFTGCLTAKKAHAEHETLVGAAHCIYLFAEDSEWECVANKAQGGTDFILAFNQCGGKDESIAAGDACEKVIRSYPELVDGMSVYSCDYFIGYKENWSCISEKISTTEDIDELFESCGFLLD